MGIQGGVGNMVLSMAELWVAVDNAVFLPALSPDYFPA